MPDLNLRNIDPDLLAKLKSDAALNGVTLREHCIGLLAFGSSAFKQRIGQQYDAAFTANTNHEWMQKTAQSYTASPPTHAETCKPTIRKPLAERVYSDQGFLHAINCKCLMCKPPKPS